MTDKTVFQSGHDVDVEQFGKILESIGKGLQAGGQNRLISATQDVDSDVGEYAKTTIQFTIPLPEDNPEYTNAIQFVQEDDA